MYTVALRQEPARRRCAVVMLRAGARSVDLGKLAGDAARSARTIGIFGVSVVAALPGETLKQAWARSPITADRDVVWQSTAGRLRDAGFALLPTGRDPRHYTVVLHRLDRQVLTRLVAQFAKEVRA